MATTRVRGPSGTSDFPSEWPVSASVFHTRNNTAHIIMSWHGDNDLYAWEYDYDSPAYISFINDTDGVVASFTWRELFGEEPDQPFTLYHGWLSEEYCRTYANCLLYVYVAYKAYDGGTETSTMAPGGFFSISGYAGKSWATTPSLSYDTAANEFVVGPSNMRGAKLLEFRDVDAYNSMSDNEVETRHNFMLSSMINLEGSGDYSAYYHNCEAVLHRWAKNREYTVGFTSLGGTCDGIDYETTVKNTMGNVITDINLYMGEFGIQFSWQPGLGDNADVVVCYGTMSNLWPDLYPNGYTGGWIQGGMWHPYYDSSENICGARVEISADAHRYTTFSRICLEEFYQMLGCGYDQWECPTNASPRTMYTTTMEMGGMHNPESLTEKDVEMLRLTYSDLVDSGQSITEVSVALDLPYGVKLVAKDGPASATNRVSASFLKPGHNYEVRAWVVDKYGDMSVLAGVQWLPVRIPESSRPVDWKWEPPIVAGEPIKVRAQDWMNFCARINEFRAYVNSQRGDGTVPPYGAFVTVTPNTAMSATEVNHAVWAISAMNPPTAPPADVKGGYTISASFFNGLRDALNSIP